MAHSTLSRRDLNSKTNAVGNYVTDFECRGYAAYFYLGTPEGPIHYGSKAIEQHVTNHLEEIISHPEYRPAPRDFNADESVRVLRNIEILRANLHETESKMKMMELRQHAVNLLQKVVPAGTKKIYSNLNNRPIWFPEELEWKHMNLYRQNELRTIIAACYEHFGLDVQVTPAPLTPGPLMPDPSQPMSSSKRRGIKRHFKEFEQRMTQGTQTSPVTSPITEQTAQQTSPTTTPSTSFTPQPIIPSKLPAASPSSTDDLPILHPVDDAQQMSSRLTTLQPMSLDTSAFPARGTDPSPILEPNPQSTLVHLRRTQRQGKGKRNHFL